MKKLKSFLSLILLSLLCMHVLFMPSTLFAFEESTSALFTPKSQMIAQWKELCDAHPQWALYESIGKSILGNDIYIFRIGNPIGGAVMWDGSLHGWEDIGSEVEYLMANWLLTSNSAEANRILQRNYVLFVPVVNVDSTERGNRDFANGATYGVDLNRNFVTGFRYISPPGTDQLPYHGLSGGSEPETKAMRNAFQTYHPKIYVNCHYGGGPWLQSSGTNATLTNWIQNRIAQISNANGFAFPWSISSGGGGGGTAVADANSYGANSWLWEIASDAGAPYKTGSGSNAYMHKTQTMADIQTWYFPKMLPALEAMCEAVEVVSVLPSPTPSPTPTWTPTPTPTSTPTPTPTTTSAPTRTPTPTFTPTVTPTSTPTPGTPPTPTPTPYPASPTLSPTLTPSPSQSASASTSPIQSPQHALSNEIFYGVTTIGISLIIAIAIVVVKKQNEKQKT